MALGQGEYKASRQAETPTSTAPAQSEAGRDLQPPLALPKGGGAIRGIGEKFATNPVTGTGSMTIPIATSPGRAGFGPQLSLAYDSGDGNGPFGFGWNLSLPAITRKTDKGLPQYRDAEEADVFLFSGAEDLVPVLAPNGKIFEDTTSFPAYTIRRYRPRIEGLFVRIERWTRLADGDVHWRVLSKENILTIYGQDSNSRISDPANSYHIFSWLLCETRDDKGNAIIYEYKAEDATDVDLSQLHERNRGDQNSPQRQVNRYIKSIKYGNRTSLLDDAGQRPLFVTSTVIQQTQWMFEVVFDYGEHSVNDPKPSDNGPWLCRHDPFSLYRAGFEQRTYRLCQRILTFHHFPDEQDIGQDYLVHSTDILYRDIRNNPSDRQRGHPIASFIASVTQNGYKRVQGGGYSKKSLPPLEFEYSQAVISQTVQHLDVESLENIPGGINDTSYQWVDLNGEGLSGILTEQADAWFYKPNLGNGKFGPIQTVASRPALARLQSGRQQLMDLTGHGQLDLVQFDHQPAGFFERTQDEDWAQFVSFTSLPNLDWDDPNLRIVDLTGDGLADVLIAENEVFTWYPSLAEAGFGPAQQLHQALDEEEGPRLVFADGTQTIFLADMSGDGLTDLVRIRDNEVSYWPNCGYGRFGARVKMDHAPWLSSITQFDPHRIRLADIDGSGATDLLYLGASAVYIWSNQAGNSWSEPQRLADFPHIDNLSTVKVVDLLGNGTACVVWSSPLPGDAVQPMSYIDLMGGQKPHLLIKTVNNMGAETRIQYATSTRFYLADKLAGKPWITRLPFPVHVVERVEKLDHISRQRFVSQRTYHHGYFDGVEREFRGFGMVEQLDTEAFEDYVVGVQHMEGNQELAPELYQPPVTTRTWFHTGAFVQRDNILHQLSEEYYDQKHYTPEPTFPADMSEEDFRECVRALKGLPLRQEIYSFDGSPQERYPYSVMENNYDLRLFQPRAQQRHAICFSYGCEVVTLYFERNPADPRISHAFTLEIDQYGHALKASTIVYGRQTTDPSLPQEVTSEQQKIHITYGEVDYTPDIDQVAPNPAYRVRVSHASRSYEITGVAPTANLFTLQDLKSKIAGTTAIAYEIVADDVTAQKRLTSQGQTLFLDNALNPLPVGQWDTLALGHQSYQLAFTPSVTSLYYNGTIIDADFVKAGYVHFNGDNNWWIPSGTANYPANPASHFYLPAGARDAFGTETTISFDKYDLLIERVQLKQASWYDVSAVNDYRILGPVIVTDPNKNRSAVEIDELGMVVGSAVMGKVGANEGDTLADPTMRMEYELFNWQNHGKPNFAHVFAREQHGANNPRWHESYTYSNGSGGIAMVKAQANPGKALLPNPNGTATEVDANPRWVGNGRTILNNKGNPVKQYEPFFSTTFEYEDEKALREIGSTPVVYYDAVGRRIRTLYPNGTLARVEFDPWVQRAFDANDTVKQSQWYADWGSPDPLNQPEPLNNPEQRAAWLAAQHADTPGTTHLDSLGRSVYVVSDYGGGKTSAVRSQVDLTARYSKLFDQKQREIASGFMGIAGTPIYGKSAEKGQRWTFLNVLGALVKTWDEHGRVFRAEYDDLQRPLGAFVQDMGQAEMLFTYLVYGDGHPNAVNLNLLGVVHQIFDPAGMVRIPGLDFKSNPTSVERVLAKDYTKNPDWNVLHGPLDYASLQAAANPLLEITEIFSASATVDALNRPTQVTLPDGTIVTPTYNEGNFLASLQAQIRGQGALIDFLKDQDYDAKGQRQFAHYGNEVFARYFYDPQTFRLINLLTYKNGDDPATQSLQNLKYTYDPAGNITQIRDDAQQTHYFSNAVVKPEGLYAYDALYQLVRASGREHAGQVNDTIPSYSDLAIVPQLPHVNDNTAVRNYTETYEYDLLGNITKMQHSTTGPTGNWTQHYRYAYEDDPNNTTNRLARSSLPGDADNGPYSALYSYDLYGNMAQMPNITSLAWNFLDQLQHVDLGGGGNAYYVYGAGRQRVRKVIERQGGLRVERIYLGSVEIYRERQGANAPHFERYTLHIADNVGRIAQVDIKTRDDNNSDPANPLNTPLIRYQYGNHLGSAILETDEVGQVISYEEYHPYGTSAYRSAKPGVDISLKRYRYCGKERDDETGLYYCGARYYAAWLGRWTSSDPAGFVDGLDLYRYCRNNPVMLHDPNGTDSFTIDGKPPEIRRAQLDHTAASGRTYEAWVRSQTLSIDGHNYQVVGGTLSWVNMGGRGHWMITGNELREVADTPAAPDDEMEVTVTAPPRSSSAASTNQSQAQTQDQSQSQPANPVSAARQGVVAGSAPTAGDPLSTTLRGTPGGTPRNYTPGESLWDQPYNLWSGGVNWSGGRPSSVSPGSGADQAMRKPGYIMEDTSFENAAETTAQNLSHSDRFAVPYDTTPGSDFNKVWGPTSDELATNAGLSQTTVTSNGLDAHPNPGGTVQVTREIPRVQIAGGLMAQAGKISGILTIVASSNIDNRAARYTGYGAGATEFVAGNAYLIGSSSIGSGLFTEATTTGLMTFGRVGGGVGAGVGQAVIYGDMAYHAAEQGDDVAAYVYAGAAIGGVAIAVGAVIGAPVLVAAGAIWGAFALGFQIGRWLRD